MLKSTCCAVVLFVALYVHGIQGQGIVGVDVVHTKTWENVTLGWDFNFPEEEYVFIEIQKVTMKHVLIYGIAFKPRGGKFVIYDTMKGRVMITTTRKFGVRVTILGVSKKDAGLYQCIARLRRGSYLMRHVTRLSVAAGAACASMPCRNNGSCESLTPKTYNCSCLEGFAGRNCEISYEPLGCFDDAIEDRALPIRINNFRDDIDWKNMDKTIKQCSAYAMKLGYSIFALQFYGECWTGKHADTTYDKHGPSTSCWEGVGAELTNFVYRNHLTTTHKPHINYE